MKQNFRTETVWTEQNFRLKTAGIEEFQDIDMYHGSAFCLA